MKIVIDIPKGLYYSVVDGCADECTKALQSAFKNGTPLPKGLIQINDAMSVFDDFMCGDVDEDGMETFYEMLKERVIEVDKEGANNV